MEYKFLPSLMGRVRGLLTQSGSATSHAISGSTAATSGPYGGAFTAFGGGWDVDRAVQDGLERVIWVFRCIDAIASNQAKLPFIIRKDDPDSGKKVEDHPLLFTMNRRANKYETSNQFRYRLSGQLLLSKRGAFVEKQRTPSGKLQFHLLPPGNVEPIPDPERFVSGYRLMTANEGEVILPPEKVIWLRAKPHPIDPYLQLTPLTAAGLAIETDFLARLFNRNFLLNDGRPGLLINIAGQLQQRDAEEIKKRFTGSPHQAGRTTVIESDAVTVNDLSATPRDLQWLEAITGTKSDILLAFGTPESVLGNASGRTYDNADAEAEVWWEETMVPHCNAIGSGFDPETGGVDDDLFLCPDYDTVDVLQRRKRARQQDIIQRFKDGVATIDEVLEATGREKWDVPGTRVLILPNGLVIGRNDADVEEVAQLPTVGVEQQADIAKEAQRGAQIGSQLGQRNFDNIISARAMQLAGKQEPRIIEAKAYEPDDDDFQEVKIHPYEALRAETEANFDLFLGEWSNFQEETIMGRLSHAKVLKYTRHWEGKAEYLPRGEGKALNTAYVVDTQRWASGIESSMETLLKKTILAGLKEAAEEMHASGITRAMHALNAGDASARSPLLKVFGTKADVDQAVSDLLSPFNNVVTTAATNQASRVADVIREMDQQGASLTAIKQRVGGMLSTRGSWRQGLSSAMATSVLEAARHKAFSQAGPIVNKIWNTVEDEHVRKTHRRVDGDEVPITKSFHVGAWQMDYPGDPKGGIEERINCFPAESLVDAGAVTGAFRRWYSGVMVKVVIPGGKEITGTPNHPVLTQRGWVRLGELTKLDKVIRHYGDIHATGSQDVNRVPTTIGETFDALAMTRDVVRISGLGVDFHGERPHGNVDVVTTTGELRDNPDTPADKFVREFLLPSADVLPRLLADGSTSTHLGGTAFDTAHSIMRSIGPSGTLIGSGSIHAGVHGVTAIARLNTGADQALTERTPVDSSFVSQSLLGLTGKIALEQVVEIRYENWSGHVYNLQTETGAYTINGIVVHNCRCYVDYVISPEAEDLYDLTAGEY